MASNYPNIAGNIIVKIIGNIVQKANSGDTTTITLSQSLPSEVINAINDDFPIYANLGCRIGGLIESVLIVRSSYNEQNKTLRIKRGMSPYYNGLNGVSYLHQSSAPNSIELNFNTVNPNSLYNLSKDVDSLKNNINSYIQSNIPLASNSVKGTLLTSYFNPSKSITEPYSVITNDNPLLRSVFASLLNITANDSQLNFDQPLTPSNAARLGTVSALLSFFINNPNNVTKIINLINLQP